MIVRLSQEKLSDPYDFPRDRYTCTRRDKMKIGTFRVILTINSFYSSHEVGFVIVAAIKIYIYFKFSSYS